MSEIKELIKQAISAGIAKENAFLWVSQRVKNMTLLWIVLMYMQERGPKLWAGLPLATLPG